MASQIKGYQLTNNNNKLFQDVTWVIVADSPLDQRMSVPAVQQNDTRNGGGVRNI